MTEKVKLPKEVAEAKFNNYKKLKASWRVMRDTDPTLPEDFKEDVDSLFELAERAERLEAELKETIAKKNRHLKDKDKRIKKLEWSNMIHKNGHGRIYAELHELKESLKRGDSNA